MDANNALVLGKAFGLLAYPKPEGYAAKWPAPVQAWREWSHLLTGIDTRKDKTGETETKLPWFITVGRLEAERLALATGVQVLAFDYTTIWHPENMGGVNLAMFANEAGKKVGMLQLPPDSDIEGRSVAIIVEQTAARYEDATRLALTSLVELLQHLGARVTGVERSSFERIGHQIMSRQF